MASGSRFPIPTLDRQGDSHILTVPAWRGTYTFVFFCVFTFLLLILWIPAFLLPMVSEWSGGEPTLSAGQKVSGWVWILILLGLGYSALYQLKGRLVLVAGPERLVWVRDRVLFRTRREYLGRHIRDLRWSMPEKMERPLGLEPVHILNGSILCDYAGRTVMLTGLFPAVYGRPLVDTLAQVYAKTPERPGEAAVEQATTLLASKTEIQERNGTLRIVRSGRNARIALFLTVFTVVWSFFGILLLANVLSEPASNARAVAGAGDTLHWVMMRVFLAFWSLIYLVLIPQWLFSINGREEVEVDEVAMLYRKRFILFSTSRRIPRRALANIRVTDNGMERFESAEDRQNRAYWGQSSFAVAYDAAGKTKRMFAGAGRQECDAIAQALAKFSLPPSL